VTKTGDTHPLTFEDKEITLIGTAHVSKESADLVGRVIEEQKPDTVCVELCPSRYQAITQQDRWRDTDLVKVIREKKAFLLLSNLMLAYFQKKIGQKFGIKPGEEMLRAIQVAEATGARIQLAGAWDEITEEEIEKMKEMDVLETVLSEIGEAFPEIRRVLIDERDQYLAHEIRTAPGKKIVAVVGAGHVPGVQRYWDMPVDMDVLRQIPPKSRLFSVLKWGLPTLIVGLIILGFFTVGMTAGTHMITWWVLANAIMGGLGAAIALGHPLTVLSAIIASPITSLNPMIAAGWVSGLVEALVGKPKVRDFESLSEDISSLKGFWKNKITRILLVVAFTNVGSSLGTFVAIPLILRALA
jgi:pheromone shutdown protein TraB